MEEALWSLEDKWKVSTHKAIALFACTSLLVVGVCVATVALRRRRRSGSVDQEETGRWAVVKALMGSVRWSKWEEKLRRDAPSANGTVIPGSACEFTTLGWGSHNSSSAVWQRPILMGEKCELPRFSGLIMYDHKGMPLHHFQQLGLVHKQEMIPAVVTTTLGELL